MKAAREKVCKAEDKRTPVKTRVRRIEAGIKPKTSEKKKKEVKRLKKGDDLSPGQRKIEAFFLKKTMVGRTGLSREAINTNVETQGAESGPLKGVLSCGASNLTSVGSKLLPVERGGGSNKRGKKSKLKLLERWPYERKPAGEPPPEVLGPLRQSSKEGKQTESKERS